MSRKSKSTKKLGQDHQGYNHDVVTDALPFELPQQQIVLIGQDIEDVAGSTGITIYDLVSTSSPVKNEVREMGFSLEDIDKAYDYLSRKKNGKGVTAQELVEEILGSQGATGTTIYGPVSTQTTTSSSTVKYKVQEMGFSLEDINKAYDYLRRKKRGESVTAQELVEEILRSQGDRIE